MGDNKLGKNEMEEGNQRDRKETGWNNFKS